MRIYQPITFEGSTSRIQQNALIDTGAEISLIPLRLAIVIGAWNTGRMITIGGIHRQSRTLPLGAATIYFPSLNNIGGQLCVAVSDVGEEPIIGMDILKPLGISIDTRTHQLSVKNELWEAFKTLSAIVTIAFLGVTVAKDSIFEEKKSSRRARSIFRDN